MVPLDYRAVCIFNIILLLPLGRRIMTPGKLESVCVKAAKKLEVL
jgi:hypothetical protein